MKAHAPRDRKNAPSGVRSPAGPRQDMPTRAMFGAHFAHDFSGVPVHAATAAGHRLLQRQAAPAAQNAQSDMQRFVARAPYVRRNFRTANGHFDATYDPPFLFVEVRVLFDLHPAKAWTKSERESWKNRYLIEVSKKWTNARFVLQCAEPGWESLTAQVIVDFQDIERVQQSGREDTKDLTHHWLVKVEKVSRDTPGHGVTRPDGTVELNSEALSYWKTPAYYQRSAVHESGHMLGLSDLYTNPNREPGVLRESFENRQKAFQARVKKELGAAPPARDDTRIMSGGERTSPPDAVSFVEAIRAATRKNWSILPVK